MTPEAFLVITLAASAALIVIMLSLAIWSIRGMRDAGRKRARKDAASRRRVNAAIDRHELGHATLTVPDRFGAIGGPDGEVVLTAEPQQGDLSSAMIVPQPPFDVTDAERWTDWESADRKRRRAIMLAGYLSHPLPRVRVEALDLLSSEQVEDPTLSRRLAIVLLEDDRTLRTRSARAAWGHGRLPEVVAALVARADGTAAPALTRAYTDLENGAPRDERLSLPRAVAAAWTSDRDEAAALAEVIELYAPDRAGDHGPVAEIGRRLEVQGGAEALARAAGALRAVRGADAEADAAQRWSDIGRSEVGSTGA